ncbi:MAG: 2-oxoacid:acceptor oxidoreductase subunit alpha [Candidatus Hydrogenedentes bacterium]|nr:2-oxoacid:acceptor oxidoreductase subunit alpha [Candidatus Hydrogenedentota bacterium]
MTPAAAPVLDENARVIAGDHFMLGDHACAEGALAAGLDFYGGYPITPSTEIMEHLAERLPAVGGTFVQMEDEIASVAAIIGASVAGARVMTATSGPGFSLMMENIGLAAIMEVPIVIVDVQRASPSTGLPTSVGQSDLLQVRWGSHGDYSVIVYCPSSPQECFDLTIAAFNSADQYRVPSFVLMDEIVGHMTEHVVVPPKENIPRINRKRPSVPPGSPDFLPFKADEDLVPPMAHAGEGYKVHMTGLTHDERGYPSLTAQTHEKLINRIVDKVRLNADRIVRYELINTEDAEVVVVALGCTARSARRAVARARMKGIRAGMLRPITMWPFPQTVLKELAGNGVVKRFVVPEINLGQLCREVQRHTALPVTRLNHPGGAMITPDQILEALEA